MNPNDPKTRERIAAANARLNRAIARYDAFRGELDCAQAAVVAAFALPQAERGDAIGVALARNKVVLDEAATINAEARDAELELQLLRHDPGVLS